MAEQHRAHDGLPSEIGPLWKGWLTRSDTRVLGEPLPPRILALKSNDGDHLSVMDSLLTDPLEMIVGGSVDGARSRFCIYMADQRTWIEPNAGSIQQIAPYEIAIMNSGRTTHTVSSSGTRHLSLVLPRSLVLDRVSCADEICGGSFDLDANTQATAQSVMTTLRSSIELSRFDIVGSSLIQTLLLLLSVVSTDTSRPKPIAVVAIREAQVDECIRLNFSDPDLNVSVIAEKLNVSSRYLQRICESGASPSGRLRQYRLRTAAERLRSPSWKRRSITEICFSCGFNSSSHFSTEFRRLYGVSPRDYRLFAS